MREKAVAGFFAAAGGLGASAAVVYMNRAPDLARIAGTAAIVLFWIGLASAAFIPRGRLKAWMEYALVGGLSAVFGVLAWVVLGMVPAEAKAVPPELTAEIQQDGLDFYLVVENRGTQAVVWAYISIEGKQYFEGVSDDRVYAGYWETSKGPTTNLRRGQRDRLLVGGTRDSLPIVASSIGDVPRIYPQALRFAFHDPEAGRGEVAQVWYRDRNPVPPEPLLLLSIVLRSDPTMPADMIGRYNLGMRGLVAREPMSLMASQSRR